MKLDSAVGTILGIFVGCLIVTALAIGLLFMTAVRPEPPHNTPPPAPGVIHATIVPLITPHSRHPRGKPIYFGGIHNMTDLYAAMHDPYVADNFEGFEFATAHIVVLDRTVLAYVAYQIDGHGVFWATNAIVLLPGETVWTDDNGNYLRTKCGNRIAFAPGLRVAPEEEVPELPLTFPRPPAAPILPIAPVHPRPPLHAFYPKPPVPLYPFWPPVHGGPPIVSTAGGPMPGAEIGAWIFGLALLLRKVLRRQ